MSISPTRLVKSIRDQVYFAPDYDRDKFLASYPRSGNTWLRAISFHAAMGREPLSMAELDDAIPDIHVPIKKKSVTKQDSYIVKTHAAARLNVPYKRVLYVIRDPRDVLPSHFRYARKAHDNAFTFQEFCEAALKGAQWPCSWREHVLSWEVYQKIGRGEVFFVNYDLLKAHSGEAANALGGFLDMSPDDVIALLELYNLDKMKTLEAAGRRDGQRDDKTNWFVGAGAASEDNRAIVDQLIRDVAPEYIEVMQRHGFAL